MLLVQKPHFEEHCPYIQGFPGGSVSKESACHGGDAGDSHSIPGLGRSLGGGYDNPLQYSCLENPMDRGALQVIVSRIPKTQTQLSTHECMPSHTQPNTGWINHMPCASAEEAVSCARVRQGFTEEWVFA